MSVVAWDGKSLAADRQMASGDSRYVCQKLWAFDTHVFASTGLLSSALALIRWYRAGAQVDRYPECQQDKDRWSRLLVLSKNTGDLSEYEQTPDPLPVIGPYWAWGSGADLAIGALAMGASARQAVEVACQFNLYCGLGVDVYTLRSPATKAKKHQ